LPANQILLTEFIDETLREGRDASFRRGRRK
jgi:hypothetical protein